MKQLNRSEQQTFMSIIVNSEDKSSGEIYNGTWTFESRIQGTYQLLDQYLSVADIPWMWSGTNTLVFEIEDPEAPENPHSITVNFDTSIGLLDDPDAIMAELMGNMAAAFATEAETYAGWARVITAEYGSDTNKITYTFDLPVTVKWSSESSTINESFYRDVNTEEPDEEAAMFFSIYCARMILNPQFLECYITQSATSLITARGTFPTLIWKTSDLPITSQSIAIRESTDQLEIKVYLPHISVSPVNITNSWYMLFG